MKLLGDLKNAKWCNLFRLRRITFVSQIICSQVSHVVRKLLALAIKLGYLWFMVLLLVTDFGLWVTLHVLLSLLSSLFFLGPLPSMAWGHWGVSSCYEWNIAIWWKKGKNKISNKILVYFVPQKILYNHWMNAYKRNFGPLYTSNS